MLTGVGVAWLWSDVIIQSVSWLQIKDLSSAKRYWPRLVLVTLVALVVLGQNFLFLRKRMDLHNMLGRVYKQAITLATTSDDFGRASVFVNFPAWISPGDFTYALGHEGVQFLPHYAHPQTIVSVNTGRSVDLSLVKNEAIRPEMPYFSGLSGSTLDWTGLVENGGDVYVAGYSPESITLRLGGSLVAQTVTDPPLAHFEGSEQGGDVSLLRATTSSDAGELVVNLVWKVNEPLPEHVTVFVHVIDEQGQLIAQIDGDPLGGAFPMHLWPEGLTAVDRRMISDEGLGQSILVGLYDRLTGERLPAVSPAGQRWFDDAIIITLDPSD